MESKRVSELYPQRKRTSGQQRDKPEKASSKIKSDALAQKELEILKQFDLVLDYGPCIGISRIERWERAQKHGLNPPNEVKEIISRHPTETAYTQCLWNDYNI